MISTAILSDDGLYRYGLLRQWDQDLPVQTFVMLNPSTADATLDDPTIRRCIGFAKREGAGGIWVMNLFAWRATKPADMYAAADPVGPANDQAFSMVPTGAQVIVAWGAGAPPERVNEVRLLLSHAVTMCLGTTADGSPRHPLYVKGDQPLEVWG